jgi:hypothetical protein
MIGDSAGRSKTWEHISQLPELLELLNSGKDGPAGTDNPGGLSELRVDQERVGSQLSAIPVAVATDSSASCCASDFTLATRTDASGGSPHVDAL